jgi:hypothetical protein
MNDLPYEGGTSEITNQSVESEVHLQCGNQEINITNKLQMEQRLKSIISEEGEKPTNPTRRAKKIHHEDQIVTSEYKALTASNCRTGSLLSSGSY